MFAALPTRIKDFARNAGFELCGIAPVREFKELRVFPLNGFPVTKNGDMKYLESRD